jgi:hypothetical protein
VVSVTHMNPVHHAFDTSLPLSLLVLVVVVPVLEAVAP